MAASIAGVFEDNLKSSVDAAKVLVVGAGGIGCEVLKNLVLSGFKDIEIIDLDTIDVSNLNRQFLFHKQHVGKSKAAVARESALKFNPNVTIKAYHDSITSSDYGASFFKRFAVVLNALDNRAARVHVNRLCLAADVPLIESGTAGYDGQVELIKKGITRCYECEGKKSQKTFPSCTIRNTPSEPIHCIVWGKHLFNQLFGEFDADEDVSPDTADPEAAGDAGKEALIKESNEQGNVDRVSTRAWAQSCGYDPEKLFQKLFHDDIKYLLSMGDLWKKRRPPTPLVFGELPDAVAGSSKNEKDAGLKDLKDWSIAECAQIFSDSCRNLKNDLEALKEGDHLVWDKDDKNAMDFVAACANIRAYIFGIPQKNRFDIKSMAGNIIPAIATTNAIIAGIVVLHAFKVLQDKLQDCQTVYQRPKPNPRNRLIVREKFLIPPNSNCFICSNDPKVTLCVDIESMTVKELEEQVLKKTLHMVAPDAYLADIGSIIISSEEGETSKNDSKPLKELRITDGCTLAVDDYLQNYSLKIRIFHKLPARDGPTFEIIADPSCLKPNEDENKGETSATNGASDKEDDDFLELVEDENNVSASDSKKRKTDETGGSVSKKLRTEVADEDGTIVVN